MPFKISSWFTHSQSSVQVVNSSLSGKRKLKKTTNYQLPTTNQRHWRFGFTLNELLFAVAIVGILATFTTARYSSAQKTSRDTQRKADIDAIAKALEMFSNDTAGGANYPTMLRNVFPPNTVALEPTYMKKFPKDPKSSQDYIYRAHTNDGTTDCWGGLGNGGADVYMTPATASQGTCRTYTLAACLENNNDNGSNTFANSSSFNYYAYIGCPTTQRIYQVTSQ